MTKRRDFIKTSALSVLGSSLVFIPTDVEAHANSSLPVVKQPEDCETFYVRENTPITFHILKVTDNVKPVSVCTEEIQPGGQIPRHKHLHADEYFYFLSGSGTVTVNDKESPFKDGTSAFVPKNTWHSIKNTGLRRFVCSLDFHRQALKIFSGKLEVPRDNRSSKSQKKNLTLYAASLVWFSNK